MHSHILYGVDDGATSMDESLTLIRYEAGKGVSHIILTPHLKRGGKNNYETITDNFRTLSEAVKAENLNVELHLGSELYLGNDYFEVLCDESIITLAGSDYILMEFSLIDIPRNIPEICYEARLKGYIPVIAHAERYETLFDNERLVGDILNEGAHFQVNASSVISKEDKDSHKFVNYLLKNQLISFVASDVHHMDKRGFYLDEAYTSVVKTCSKGYADRIFKENQQNIISNKFFDSPKLDRGRKGLLSKLFNK
ncbi:MAG: CpsB/CapC family capsule biosynthesis tyrosine phosphatase [Sedimentibacter sp.]|uniref:tyrosine-protein phosphatase n=1 Tax=Sedimentibacter sp. TaxID=1960295 RepID=UPI0031591F3F